LLTVRETRDIRETINISNIQTINLGIK